MLGRQASGFEIGAYLLMRCGNRPGVALANSPSNCCDLRAIEGNHGALVSKAGDRFQGGA
jgi:hypothetical protein